MTPADLQDFFDTCIDFALIGGFIAGLLAYVFVGLTVDLCDWFDRRFDTQLRIKDARWRGRWYGALREAREAGYEGRRAIAYAVDAMKTRRQANADLRAHG